MADGGLAVSIDSFLGKRGSPLAGYGNVFVATGRKYGVDPRLVVGISGIESSFGKLPYGSYNAWGWGPGKPFGSWEEAINTVTRGLKNGYISQGLVAPIQIANKYAPGSDGNDPQHWADTVSLFIKQLGGQPRASRSVGGPTPIGVPATSSTPSTSFAPPPDPYANLRSSSQNVLTGIARTGHIDATAMLDQIAQGQLADTRAADQWQAALAALPKTTTASSSSPTAPPPSSGPSVPTGKGGPPVQGTIIGTPYSGTHGKAFNVRGGSDNWESENAVDVRVPVGTPIRAVSDGTIGSQFGSLGSGGRFAGLRLHLNTGDNDFYYAHLSGFAPGIKPGAQVRAGQVIGYSGEANGVPHLHFGVENGDPRSYWKSR